ncbi:MAG: Spy0128 family protein [Lachnospiraceae bacterium]
MGITIHKKRIIGMLMAILLPWLSPQAADAASTVVIQLEAEQVFTQPEGCQAADTFSYTLTAEDSGCPMPVGSSGDICTFTMSGTETVTIGTIAYRTMGTYNYIIKQTMEPEQRGFTYDTQEYTMSVNVIGMDEGLKTQVVIKNNTGNKAAAISFENTYEPLASDPSIMVDPPVRKIVNGTPSVDGTFTFKLEAEYKLSPMPTGSTDGVKLITIVGEGEEDFGTWSYTEAGTYHYIISEVNNDESGYAYDTTVYTITDLVSDVEGQLEVTRTVTNINNEQVDSYDFVNQYKSDADRGGITGGTSGNTKGVKTGDDANPELYLVLFFAGGMVLLAYISYKIRRKMVANPKKK